MPRHPEPQTNIGIRGRSCSEFVAETAIGRDSEAEEAYLVVAPKTGNDLSHHDYPSLAPENFSPTCWASVEDSDYRK